MKKRLPVGLVVAIVLLLLTVTAIAAVLLTPQEVVEQVAVPLAQQNDTDWRVNTDFSPEELAALIQACAENGIDLNENARIIQALQNGEGYDEEEAIMQMNLLGHSFFVFFNARTERVNIVYKRNRENEYGLIDPEV